jgi:hypothetical protein
MQDIEVELLPTFIVYFKSELLSPHFSKGALEPDGAFKFTNFKSGFTNKIFVKEELTPLLSIQSTYIEILTSTTKCSKCVEGFKVDVPSPKLINI